jgi:Tfp pilus assembly protein PilF
VQAFDQAIALQPSYAKAYLSMALSYQRMGNLPAARQSLQRLLQVEPENATAARLLSRL